MQAEEARFRLVHQVHVVEIVEQVLRLVQRQAGQRRRGRRVEQRRRIDPQQPEHPLRRRRELPVREGERAGHRPVLGGQFGQRRLAQPPDQIGDPPPRPMGKPRPGQPQRQRQPAAAAHHLGRGVGLGLDPIARDPGEQRQRLGRGEHVELFRVHAVQPDQPAAAGDQRERPGRGGQQVGELSAGLRVVQHHQHAPPGQLAAPQRDPVAPTGRNRVGREAELAQQDQQRGRRLQGLLGAVPVQVDEEMRVRVLVADQGRHVQRERRLAAAGHPVDHRDRRAGPPQLGQQSGDHLVASGEVADRTRKAADRRRLPGAQHPAVQVLQFLAGLDAQLIVQHLANTAKLGHRVRGTPGRGQRPDQLLAQPLAQREPLHRLAQHADQLTLVPGGQLQLGPVLDSGGVLLVQGGRGGLHRPAVDADQGPAPPQVEGLAEHRRLARCPGPRDQPGEDQRVQLLRAGPQPVPGRVGVDHAGWQRPAEPGDAGLQLGPGGRRRLLAPHRVDQLGHADHPLGVQQQHGQHDPVPAGGDRGYERAQDSVGHAASRRSTPCCSGTPISRNAARATRQWRRACSGSAPARHSATPASARAAR